MVVLCSLSVGDVVLQYPLSIVRQRTVLHPVFVHLENLVAIVDRQHVQPDASSVARQPSSLQYAFLALTAASSTLLVIVIYVVDGSLCLVFEGSLQPFSVVVFHSTVTGHAGVQEVGHAHAHRVHRVNLCVVHVFVRHTSRHVQQHCLPHVYVVLHSIIRHVHSIVHVLRQPVVHLVADHIHQVSVQVGHVRHLLDAVHVSVVAADIR